MTRGASSLHWRAEDVDRGVAGERCEVWSEGRPEARSGLRAPGSDLNEFRLCARLLLALLSCDLGATPALHWDRAGALVLSFLSV